MAIDPAASAMHLFTLLPEKSRAEVIDGDLFYFMGAPRLKHQRLVCRLGAAMMDHVERNQLGEVIYMPCDVYLDNHSNVVQPDIMFISNQHLVKLEDDGLKGAPDMIIEVLSPGNRRHDLTRKKELYKRFGVREYWIVDPETKRATGYVFERDPAPVITERIGSVASYLLDREFFF